MKLNMDTPVVIVPYGTFYHPAGSQVIDGKAVERIVTRMNEWDRDIVVDYQHESMKQCGRAPAAGWVKIGTVRVTNDGIEAVIDWTDEAGALIESKQYRYLSPVFETTGGVITGLVNLGLTNNPNIHAMAPLINQLTNQERLMENDLAKRLKERLELDAAADDGAIVESVEALVNERSTAPSLAEKLGDVVALLGLTQDDGDETVIARIRELAVEVFGRRENETEAVVNDAIACGRLRPSLKEWAVSLARVNPGSLRMFLVNSGPAAPLGGMITGGSAARRALTESESSVCRLLGVSEEEYLELGRLPSGNN